MGKKKKGRPTYRIPLIVRLLAPLLLLLAASCAFLEASAQGQTTTTPEQRAQALSVVQAADDALLLAAGWMEPQDFIDAKATVKAMRDAIGATEFVPLDLSGMLSTAMRLAVIWALPPPPAAPPGDGAAPG